MRYGRGAMPRGFLPAFSVNTEDEAERLLVLCCQLGPDGHYYATELLGEQTLTNLQAFSDKLSERYALIASK